MWCYKKRTTTNAVPYRVIVTLTEYGGVQNEIARFGSCSSNCSPHDAGWSSYTFSEMASGSASFLRQLYSRSFERAILQLFDTWQPQEWKEKKETYNLWFFFRSFTIILNWWLSGAHGSSLKLEATWSFYYGTNCAYWYSLAANCYIHYMPCAGQQHDWWVKKNHLNMIFRGMCATSGNQNMVM